MADYIKVDTELLMRTAEEARSAGQGLREAASILSGINTGEEWWAKLGQLSTLRLADEGSSTELQNARSAVRALSTVLCRYDDRMNDLGDSIAKAASIFDGAERTNNGRISGLGAGKTVGAVGAAVVGAAAGVAAIGGVVSGGAEDSEAEARKKREEHAKWIKIGAGILCAVGSIAVVVATGGAAIPVIAAGAAAGAITAGVNNAADQYADKGWDDIDWGDAGKDAVIGGIVGAVTSTLSIGGGAAGQQVVNQVTHHATTAGGRLAAHIIGGTVTSVAGGTISRAGGEAVNGYLNEGSVNWDNVRRRAFDPAQMTIDGLTGGVTGYMRGRQYNNAISAQESHGQPLRSESYRNNNPYSDRYGDVDWSQAPNGGIDSSKPVSYDYEIPSGTELRRTGYEGRPGAYVRNASDSFESASMPYEYNPAVEHKYIVVKPIPDTTKSTAAPAFDMPGGATQYKLPDNYSIDQLVKDGYLLKVY